MTGSGCRFGVSSFCSVHPASIFRLPDPFLYLLISRYTQRFVYTRGRREWERYLFRVSDTPAFVGVRRLLSTRPWEGFLRLGKYVNRRETFSASRALTSRLFFLSLDKYFLHIFHLCSGDLKKIRSFLFFFPLISITRKNWIKWFGKNDGKSRRKIIGDEIINEKLEDQSPTNIFHLLT